MHFENEDSFNDDLENIKNISYIQKMVSVGRLTSGVTHDFNNRIGLIMGFAEIMKTKVGCISDIDLRVEFELYINRIISSSKQAASLSKQLLIFSRKDKSISQSKNVDIHKITAETMDLLEHVLREKSISIVRNMAAENSYIFGHESHLQNVIFNLALNACDALEGNEKAELRICTENIEKVPDDKYDPPENSSGFLRMVISDNGRGMDEDVLSKIYNPFFTTKDHDKGTGLGLAIVHEAIQNHSAYITAESSVGAGTEFQIYFPQYETADLAMCAEDDGDYVKRKTTILVVDDEEEMLDLLTDILNGLGYNVLSYSCPKKAIEEVKVRDFNPKLALIDRFMPEIMGEDLFYMLKEISPRTKVIMASAYSIMPIVDKLKVDGLADFIPKPFSINDLSESIASVLD
ncbi:MAG: sensor histidine kinase [Planctomycetota bacterium]|jgi:nitrogen-specific signal transduction histidine kinase/CheY-like chemotaxis protein